MAKLPYARSFRELLVYRKARQLAREIGRLLGGMMAKADLFCGESAKSIRDQTAKYFVNQQIPSNTTDRSANTEY